MKRSEWKPIRFENHKAVDYRLIEWKIHNVCNYDCSFCALNNKDGSKRWLLLEEYKSYIDKLFAVANGQPVWFQVTGGEPTLFPELIPLLQYIKSKGAMLSLVSNGSRTLRWWEELRDANILDILTITYHSEQTKEYQHVCKILNLFHDVPVTTICLITHVLTSLDTAFEAFEYLVSNTGAHIVIKAMMVSYDIYSLYTPEQYQKIRKHNNHPGIKPNKVPNPHNREISTLKVTHEDGSVSIENIQNLMKQNKNRFLGWKCHIGDNFMHIDGKDVHRGVCEEGGTRSLDDDIQFTTEPLICSKPRCFCNLDMIATKTKY